MKPFFFMCFLGISSTLSAQLFVDSLSQSAEELVMDFFNNSCVDVLSVEHIGRPVQKGFFEGSNSGININAGIILATGNANTAIGPNNLTGAGGGFNTIFEDYNDPFGQFLQNIGITSSWDRSVLHIRLVPHIDSISFQYVFASEEYKEYVNTPYNDAFGFLISGPGINGVQNIAMVPNTSIPVTINTVNHLTNTGFFRSNDVPWTEPLLNLFVQFDGLTTVLNAGTAVIPDSTYEVWIGISDVADGNYCSGIFLSIESLCGDSLLYPVAGFNTQEDGTSVSFDNTTKYATAWHWDFGDGSSSTDRFPTHVYDNLDQQYTVQLTATNYCCSDTTYTIIGTSGTANTFTAADFQVLPTQFKETLNLTPPYATMQGDLVLYDLAGKPVLQQAFVGRTTLNTASLSTGIYFLEIRTNDNQRWIKKVVK